MDFFWINRDQRSFEWFVNLLSQLEIEQAELGGAMERFLEMHMYITSALQKTDMKAVGLQLALDLLHEKVRGYTYIILDPERSYWWCCILFSVCINNSSTRRLFPIIDVGNGPWY